MKEMVILGGVVLGEGEREWLEVDRVVGGVRLESLIVKRWERAGSTDGGERGVDPTCMSSLLSGCSDVLTESLVPLWVCLAQASATTLTHLDIDFSHWLSPGISYLLETVRFTNLQALKVSTSDSEQE